MGMHRKGLWVAALAAGFVLVGSGTLAADVIAERKAGFQQNQTAMRAMAASLRDGQVADLAEPARQIAERAERIPTLFPEGSGTGDTRALPAIWSDWDGFVAAAQANRAAALALADIAAGSGADAATADGALRALGASCGACHDAFRSR